MVIRLGVVAGLLIIVWHQSLLAADIKPLTNGYSGVAPQTAALLRAQPVTEEASIAKSLPEMRESVTVKMEEPTPTVNEPRLSVKLEKGADKILSSKDGVSAALGAALTATVSSNPAAVLVGGLAGIWASEQSISYKDSKSIPLGDGASSLFRTVSKTFFRGGRALVDGSKKLADKTGRNINKLRYANAPMPLKGQEPKIKLDLEAKPAVEKKANNTQKKIAAAPIPAATKTKPKTMKPVVKKVQPPVIIAAKKPKSVAKEASAKTAEKVVKKNPVRSKAKKASTVEKKPPVVAQAKKKPIEKAKLVTKRKEDTILRANTKKLQPMPKLTAAEVIPQPEQMPEEPRPWPERAFELEKEEPPVHRVLKAQMKTAKASSFQAYTPSAESEQKVAVNAQQTVDCDGAGGKVSRGRLAWMECYYRMDEE